MIKIAPPKTWPLEERIQHYFLWLLKISVVIAAVVAASIELWELFFFSLLTLALMFLPELIESRAKVKLPIEFDLVLAAFVYASLFIGSGGEAYERFWWWDAVLHVSSGFILGFAGFLLLYVKLIQHKIKAGPMLIGVVIFSFGLAFGTVWEVFEYGMDSFFGTNLQRSGLQDTMWDLIVDGLGAAFMGYIGTRFVHNPKEGLIARSIRRFIDANPHLKKGVKNA